MRGFTNRHDYPSTNEEKLHDTSHELWLTNVAIDYYHKNDKWNSRRHNVGSKLIKSNSFIMLIARRDVLQNQLNTYRKIVFPDENKLIEGHCLNCKKVTSFYRTKPETNTTISALLHCSECHFVEWEYKILNNLDTKPKTAYQEYIMSKQGLRTFMAGIAKFMEASRIMTYYHTNESQFEFKSMEEFFIKVIYKGKEGFMCPACRYIYQRKNMAEIHFNHFWQRMPNSHYYTNDGWIKGCMVGVKRSELQQLESLA